MRLLVLNSMMNSNVLLQQLSSHTRQLCVVYGAKLGIISRKTPELVHKARKIAFLRL